MDYKIRKIEDSEYGVLEDFLYEAIFIPPGMQAPPREILNSPELQAYITDFGKKMGDTAIVAETDGKSIVGAVWARIMEDYGHIDDETPSLAISIYKEYRNHGIGRALMEKILEVLKIQGFRQVSLSVQKANYAVKLYSDIGFEIIAENDEEYIMKCELSR